MEGFRYASAESGGVADPVQRKTVFMRSTTRFTWPTAILLLAFAAAFGQRGEVHAQVGPGTFAANPVFDARGTAFAVFGGGSLAQLEAAAQAAQSTGVWAQAPTARTSCSS